MIHDPDIEVRKKAYDEICRLKAIHDARQPGKKVRRFESPDIAQWNTDLPDHYSDLLSLTEPAKRTCPPVFLWTSKEELRDALVDPRQLNLVQYPAHNTCSE